MANGDKLIELYVSCLQEVLKRGWAKEVRQNRERPPIDTIDKTRFFHEYAFCVFASFFKWRTVNSKWRDLTRVFRDWDYEEICQHDNEIDQEAMRIFGNKRKVKAILKCANKLSEEGWDKFRASLVGADLSNQLKLLDDLPGIGKAARYQLAAAIGIDVAKPDRYLLQFASKYGFGATEEGVQRFTKQISDLVGERLKVVDYVLWRYSEGSCYQKQNDLC